MKTINEYLDEAKLRLNLNSDYQLGKHLGVTGGVISNWRSGKRGLDNFNAMRLGEILGRDPLAIIATTEAERENDGTKRAAWEGWAKKLQGMTAACVVSVLLVSQSPDASASSPLISQANSEPFYIMLNRIRRLMMRRLRQILRANLPDQVGLIIGHPAKNGVSPQPA